MIGSITDAELQAGLPDRDVDIVIVQVGGSDDAIPDSLRLYRAALDKRPSVTFIALQNRGRTATLFELAPTVSCLGEVTTDKIVKVIREWRGIGGRQLVNLQ